MATLPPGVPTTALDRQVRGARDRLLDLLLLGETAPLQDVPAKVDPAIVALGGSAVVQVEESQPDVTYELRDKDGAPRPGTGGAPPAAPLPGDGGTIGFPLAGLNDGATFTILARKRTGPVP